MSAGGRRRQLLRVPVEDVPRRSLVELGSGEESRPAVTAASAPSPPPPPPGSTTGGSSPAPESGPPASASSPGSGPPSSRPSGSAPASVPPPAPSRPPPPPWPTDPSPPPTDEPSDELDQEIAEDAFLDDPRPSTAPAAAMAAGGRPPPPEDEATPPPGEVGPVSGTPPSQAAPGSSEPSPPSPSVPPASSPASTEAPASSSGAPGGDEADASAPGEGTDDGDDGLELEELAASPAPHPTPPPVPGTKTAPPPPPAAVQAAVAGPPTEPRHRAPASSPPPANGSRPTPPPPTRPRKRRTRPWFEDFFNDDYVRTVPPPRRDHIAQEIDFIEASLGLAKGATILDVGCGTGLHAVELAARGYLVVGLDLSLPMLSRAADEAQERGTKINFLHGDMREMSFEGAFDAVLCWGTTFGYFDDESNRRVVERLYAALKPMGLLLLDVVNRDFVIGRQPNLVWFEGDGCVCMEETQFNYITSRLEVKRTVILDDGRQRETPYGIRLYALHELGQLLHHQGFRVAQVSGERATPGVFFGADSSRMLILAERRLPSGGASPPSPPEEALTGTTSRVPDDAAPPEDAPADDEPFD